MQLGCEFINTATFPISIIVESVETEVELMTPPRTQYPKPATRVMPGVRIKIVDERIIMNNRTCSNLTGNIDMKLKYGLPVKERFDMELKGGVDINCNPNGVVTGIKTTIT